MEEGKVVLFERRPELRVPLDQREGPQPLPSLWELFFAWSGFSARAPSTQKNCRRTAALTAELGLPDFPAPGDIAIWLERLRGLPGKKRALVTGNTVDLHHDNLHALFEWARDSQKGWSVGNPVRNLSYRRGVPVRVALRRVDETWPFLLAAAGGDGRTPESVRRRAFLAVFRFLGLRKGEALGLRASDLREQEKVLYVHVERQRRHANAWTTQKLKTERARRALPVVRPELEKLLRAVLRLSPARVWCGRGGQERRELDFLFPYREHDLTELMAALRGVAPEDFPPGDAWHVFRHTAAVELEGRGAPTEEISEWLGHRDVKQTITYLRTLVGSRVKPEKFASYFADERTRGGAPPGRPKKRPGLGAEPPSQADPEGRMHPRRCDTLTHEVCYE